MKEVNYLIKVLVVTLLIGLFGYFSFLHSNHIRDTAFIIYILLTSYFGFMLTAILFGSENEQTKKRNRSS